MNHEFQRVRRSQTHDPHPGLYLTEAPSPFPNCLSKNSTSTIPTSPAPLVSPGDWVWVKIHKRQSLQPRWKGPYKVLLGTPFSASLAGKSGAR